tara:strand:- start:3843 stop:4457 length:615 start_codon:yes stop_codon:yes gene_type:complete
VRKIGLVDYGMGNIHSVKKALENLEEEVLIIKNKDDINQCKGLIIPGQGAFDPAIKNLYKTDLIDNLKDWIAKGNPFLGICLGLQLLFEYSEEGDKEGLGFIKGGIKKIPQIQNQKIPHIGWCKLIIEKESKLLSREYSDYWVYFDHSYFAVPSDKELITASVEYGPTFLTAVVEYENLLACQFHPEKSGEKGEIILHRWLQNI